MSDEAAEYLTPYERFIGGRPGVAARRPAVGMDHGPSGRLFHRSEPPGVCSGRDPRCVLGTRRGRVVRLRPEGPYGRRKLTAFLRRTSMPTVAQCTVVRAMKTLGHQGIRRAKAHRTTMPAKDGIRAGDLLNRDLSSPAPNVKWVTDFTYCRT